MRVARLPGVTELGDRPLLAVGDEDRVVAEALAAARLCRNPAADDARPAELLAVGCHRDELRHVPRPALLHSLELAERLRDRRRAFGRIARRLDTGPSSQRRDFDPRVFA